MHNSKWLTAQKVIQKDELWIGGLMFIALVLRLLTNRNYGFHRDEFLYLQQGQNLDWGFWSNPPGPGFFSWCVQSTLGDSLFAFRLVPALLGVATVGLVCLMAKEMGGNRFAQMLAGYSIMVSSGLPRAFLMYNPVPFDIFYWTLLAFILVKFVNNGHAKYLYYFAIISAFGFLNKYSVLFFVAPTLVIIVFTPLRSIFKDRAFWQSLLLGVLIILPHLYWQWQHNFPVLGHLRELHQTQLVNVRSKAFLLDQLLFNASILIIWLPGLWYTLISEKGEKYRPLGFIFLLIITLLLLLKGKSYYTLGAYPMMVAAGSCMWSQWIGKKHWPKPVVPLVPLIVFMSLMPYSVPYLSLDKLIQFGEKIKDTGLNGILRWEDGRIHDLPQDFADMLGWEELGDLTRSAIQKIGPDEPYFIYAENFGQTGAISYFNRKAQLPGAHSFADAFAFWAPESVDPKVKTLIYVNDELGTDVAKLFAHIIEVGQVKHPYARERGTSVYLCRQPHESFAKFWNERIKMVFAERNIGR